MPTRASRYRTLIFFATLLFVGLGTFFVIRYAKGDRWGRAGGLKGTGLLAANSFPTAGEVYINGKLTTATDNTLNLDPGTYQIEIKKDGYHVWNKNLTIQAELVTSTNAQLFPSSPSLDPLSFTGAENVIPSGDGDHLAFTVASASATAKNGLYVQDLVGSPINLNKTARQVARSADGFDYTQASYTWSPNSSEILVAFPSGSHIVLDPARFNDITAIKDVTVRLPQILSEWELELARTERARLVELPDFFQSLATESGQLANLYFSPDGEKLLYQALTDLEVPSNLIPPLPASSTQPESRQLRAGNWYVYDLKEDKNFLVAESGVPSPSPSTPAGAVSKLMLLSNLDPIPAELVSSASAFKTLQSGVSLPDSIRLINAQYSPIFVSQIQWYPDSSHLIVTTDKEIKIMEYDATNLVNLYAGPFDPGIVYPWPDGSRLITRIQFSPDTTPNLYTIKLK